MNPMLKRCAAAASAVDDKAGVDYAAITVAVIMELRVLSAEVLEAGCAAHPVGDYHSATHLGDIVACEWDAMLLKVLE